MVDSKQTSSEFNSEKMILFILKKSKIIAICCILAIVLSVVFSSPFFITPLFKSTVIFYPAATSSISKAVLTNEGGSQDVLAFGEEEETEQLLQILNSSIIRDQIIEKFNLLEHYNIAPGAKFKKTQLFRKYASNFKFSRTEYMAVEVNVQDRDAQTAADMANEIAVLLDETKTNMHQERARLALEIVEKEYLSLKEEIKVKEDSLSFLRLKGVYDYTTQVEMINQQLAIELGAGNKAGVKRLEDQLAILAKYGGAHIDLTESLTYDIAQLNDLKIRYKSAKVDAEASLTHKFIVDNAFKAEKKAYPVRWLIVLMSAVSVFFLSIIILLAIENLHKLKH